MTKLRIDKGDIKLITLFEKITGARVKDCLKQDDLLAFIVEEGEMGLAIGKNGVKINKVKEATKMNVVVIEHSPQDDKFINNLFYPVKLKKVIVKKQEDGKKHAIITANRKDRGKIIGVGGYRIKLARELAARHHKISDIDLKIS